MNTLEIINHAPSLFDTPEKWISFAELATEFGNIKHHWLKTATAEIRQHFRINPREAWSFEKWGNEHDTRWYLPEFGFGSLGIGFGWTYEFHFSLIDTAQFNSQIITDLLRTPKFAPIFGCFDRVDRQGENQAKAMVYRNFNFGSLNDGNIPINELAWYAGNQRQQFVDQAIRQVERFLKSEEITSLIRELNLKSFRASGPSPNDVLYSAPPDSI